MSSFTTVDMPEPERRVSRRVGDTGPLSYVRNPEHTANEMIETLRRIHAEYAEPAMTLDNDVAVTIFVTPAVAAALWHRMTPLLEEVYLVERCCRICGCTDEEGCDEGCEWVAIDLCSTCVEASVP